ncbi:MAG: hypothetical protein A2W52_03335 [Candidatus Taylorbacteria bacterium RIFCSPHIGHO2_02_49_25]|uniref:Uncharacterized protein n=1 Tax=Candidatus Taylorbacteria bacterium RIFCSPHIGHO2_02_49_25 TaxID=1802305 RepID=A0A1G2MDG0_9BACT|nr:MAG: hypothetical protein A2759_02125 [Candidatus Taylorbacteria bacterium RIFCSPHIGHO2_01_FULL_49_60]OHA21908.1 MAG: hypothetical protein A2W52_03335 [Candidatus Taylorbacteria bacterium RIFCSPHIGHO2_02_49_25]OHA36644.1 MAG: hypothetical protein A2W65_00975 [Candidatus Taylorbacteria bacterium RIFCSPLOWO2_02_50_13]OHA45754.1 MAG: hypothetical protein A3G61_03060 [Candidatus Taylorbacteria bacterium RIFCSPLOWO2_12_FULL_49_67]HCB35511.1 hypothetical protein [Candidatus Taylorbacteria bacteriu
MIIAIIILAVVLFGGLWEWIQTNETAQQVIAGLFFVFVIMPAFGLGWDFLIKKRINRILTATLDIHTRNKRSSHVHKLLSL